MPKVMPAEAEAYQSPQLHIDYPVKWIYFENIIN